MIKFPSVARGRFAWAALAGTLASLPIPTNLLAADVAPNIASVKARLETPPLFDDDAGGNADGDDPAIWVHPQRSAASLVIVTKKNAGLSVYDLAGRELQAITPPPAPGEDDAEGRFNNVDVLYGFPLFGRAVDLAVVTDRGRDQLRFYRIDAQAAAAGAAPLVDLTAADVPFVFSANQAQVNEQTTAYGLAVHQVAGGLVNLALVSQRSRTRVASVFIYAKANGTVSYAPFGSIVLPNRFPLPSGGSWTACQDDDGQESQVEGMTIDHDKHIAYLAQEQVGIWKFPLFQPGARPELIDKVRSFGVPYTRTFDPEEEEFVCELAWNRDPGFGGRTLTADAEGLTIYDAGHGAGYLLASSQGDNTFAVYGRGNGNPLIGRFAIGDGPATDGSQSCDGASVTNVPLGPAFPHGLLVVHDGDNTPAVLDDEGEARTNTNFKFVPWENVARPLRLTIAPHAADPR